MRIVLACAACLALLALPGGGAAPAAAQPAAPPYAGWAMEAYPELSAAEMEAMVRRTVQAGANVVWIGHNNPGEVEPGKAEPGLSYAVYAAARDAAHPQHAAALEMVAAQHRLLAACRAAGVRAVLPVGYQVQMGAAWNAAHPGDLRLDAQGQPLNIYGGGVSASFYSPAYRRDIAAYYRWVDAEFARPYADLLLMLNLSDEPIGGDYSLHAEAEFRRRTGLSFEQAGASAEGQRQLGAFQSGSLVEYAAWSAGLWQELHPGLPVTMSFDGAQARLGWSLPDVEALFRETPANFVVSFDAYPHDGLPRVALSEGELSALFLLARSLGLYSARYGRPVWLWAAANSWGLSQASADPGSISDAVANGISLALLVRGAGGTLQGIVYWNLNVKGQGLYNETRATAYAPDALFEAVSAALPRLRALMAAPPGRPEVLVVAPPGAAHAQIGAAREAVRAEAPALRRLEVLARAGVNAAVVEGLDGWDLDGVRAVVLLADEAGDLAAADLAAARGFLARGGQVVAAGSVAAALDAGATPGPGSSERLERRGGLTVARGDVAGLFAGAEQAALAPFWREVLGLEELAPGFRVVTAGWAFYYHLGPEPAEVRLRLPYEAIGTRIDAAGREAGAVHGPYTAVRLGRREFVLLRRLPWDGWWRA